MGVEIERKFLTTNDSWRHGVVGFAYCQGYLLSASGRTVRVRIAGERAFITIKGPVAGISRAEFEYPIPLEDARQLFFLCQGPLIEKTRFKLFTEDHLWEVDEFHGANAGLIMAEVELTHPDETVILPSWIGEEVTGDRRYYNSSLSLHPYSEWREGCAESVSIN
jgi:CYTH domain-containing protein